MSRSLFLLITGIYSALLGLSMLFLAEPSMKNYGVPTVDLAHISLMQYLGVANLGFGILSLLNRNVPNSIGFRNGLLAVLIVVLGGVLKGIYDMVILHPPMNGFFIADTVLRLAFGLGLLYFYNKETKLAQAGV